MLITGDTYASAIRTLQSFDELVCDTETTGLKPFHGDKLCGIGVATPFGDLFYFPFRHGDGYNLPLELMQPLLRILESRKALIFHNAPFDLNFLQNEGMKIPAFVHDTWVLYHVLNENEPSFKLENLAAKYVDVEAGTYEKQLLDELASRGFKGGQKAKGHLWKLPSEIVEPYACQDVNLTGMLFRFANPHLATWQLESIYTGVCEYQVILYNMGRYGILLSPQRLKDNMWMERELTEQALKECQAITENPLFNPGSPKQVCDALGISTSRAKVLEVMEHPLAVAILKYRDHAKTNGTFYEPYIHLAGMDAVIHTSYRVHGTVTGRISDAEPNMQQVPKRVRTVFIPRPGYEFFEPDYSQAELRLASFYAQEKSMIDIFNQGRDPHSEAAELAHLERKSAKILNFSVIYGVGADSLATQLNVSIPEAAQYLNQYHRAFPGFRRLRYLLQQRAEVQGYIRYPLTGRVRHYNTPFSEPHKAMPNLIQGTLGEVARLSLTRLAREIPVADARPILHNHDAFLFEIPKGHVDRVAPAIMEIMQNTSVFNPPLLVDAKHGESWGNLVPWKQSDAGRFF